MRKAFTVLIIMIAVAVVGYMVTGGSALREAKEVEGETLAKRFAVEAAPVAKGNIKQTTELTLTFAPYSSVPLLPKTGGTVERVLAATGDRVNKGQTLFIIDETPMRLQVKQAEAAYEMARANLAQVEKGASAEDLEQIESTVLQAKASYENMEAEYQRIEELYQKEMIPKKQLEAVELQKKIAATNLTAAEARLTSVRKGASEEQLKVLKSQVRQAEIALEMAELQLSYTRVTAPISGTLAQFNVEVGGIASPSAPAGVIVDDTKMKAKALVPETYINRLKVGQKVSIEAKAIPEKVFTGVISAVSPLADQVSRQFPVEFSVENPSKTLKAGMSGTASLVIDEATDEPVIPISTVLYEGKTPYVYLVVDGRAVRQDIKIGLISGEMASVQEGLAEGEMVISRGQHQVKNGILIEVK